MSNELNLEKPIELVVFDVAGTTVHDDNSVGRCFAAAFRSLDLDVSESDANSVMGLPKPIAIEKLLLKNHRRAEAETISRVHRDFVDSMIRYYRSDPEVREIEGAGQCFDRLRDLGLRVALDTGFSREILDVVIDRMGWGERIDASAASDEVERGRPHPDLIHFLMRKMGVEDVRAVAKAGDTPSDLEEGSAAGCGLVVGVISGTHSAEELSSSPHHLILGSIREIPALLGLV